MICLGPDLGRFVCIASLGQDDLICASTVRNRPDAMSVVTTLLSRCLPSLFYPMYH